MLGQKTTFKRIEIIQCLLLDDNGIKLEINKRKITGIFQNTWRFWEKKKKTCFWDFPDGPVVKTPHFECRGHWIDPRKGNKYPTCHMV